MKTPYTRAPVLLGSGRMQERDARPHGEALKLIDLWPAITRECRSRFGKDAWAPSRLRHPCGPRSSAAPMLGNWWFSMLSGRTIAIAISGALLALAQVNAAPAATPLTTQIVASRLTKPLYVTHAPGDFDRIFIVEQTGEIRILNFQTGKVLKTPFLDLSSTVSCCLEFGLLAMAVFLAILVVGFIYEWKKGALEWD